MSYTSAFTGAQMDAVFNRVSNTVIGRATLIGGARRATVFVDVPGFTNPYCIATLRLQPEYGIGGPVGVYTSYDSQSGKLNIQIVGDDLVGGYTYTVDYMLTE